MASEDTNLKSDIKKKDSQSSSDKEIKVAQVFDENEINNLSESSNLEALSPEANFSEIQGIPTEGELANSNQNLISENTEQIINTEDLEGLANDAIPQEGISSNNDLDSFGDAQIPPTDTFQGSPTQGFIADDVSDSPEDSNIQNIPPETIDQIGGPETLLTESNENNDAQNEEEINPISPEESIANAGPLNNIPENLSINEESTVIAEAPQEETLIGARPEETQEIIQNNIQEQIVQERAPLAPEQSFAEAVPSQVISETQETVAAESSIGPEEEPSFGRPIQEESEFSQNIQLAEAEINISSQISPENVNAEGNPQEGITTEIFTEPENTSIPPESIAVVAGLPEEGEVPENISQDTSLIAQVAPLKPEEETLQDYVNNVAETVLENSLENGETPQNAAIAALQAGKDAAKEVSTDSEEMNELSFNLGENLISDINNKIEIIQDTIEEQKTKGN